MGALHEGHLSLVRAAVAAHKPVVVSIFVNPAQFGPKEDFARYPRQLEKDATLLESAGADYLFAPETSDIYPPGFRTHVDVEGLGDRLEGRVRPGHFRGVTTVVLKLLEIVQPQAALLRTQGRSASAHPHADGVRLESRRGNFRAANRSRIRWARHVLAKCVSERRRTPSSNITFPRAYRRRKHN